MKQDPVVLFEPAASNAVAVAIMLDGSQVGAPTTCAEWTGAQLLEHTAGATSYLLGALGVAQEPPGTNVDAYAAALARYVEELWRPGALERRCISPAGFEWSMAEATAGTFMDQVVHTWDLAVATGQDPKLDNDLAESCVAMYVPAMPEIGRQP